MLRLSAKTLLDVAEALDKDGQFEAAAQIDAAVRVAQVAPPVMSPPPPQGGLWNKMYPPEDSSAGRVGRTKDNLQMKMYQLRQQISNLHKGIATAQTMAQRDPRAQAQVQAYQQQLVKAQGEWRKMMEHYQLISSDGAPSPLAKDSYLYYD